MTLYLVLRVELGWGVRRVGPLDSRMESMAERVLLRTCRGPGGEVGVSGAI